MNSGIISGARSKSVDYFYCCTSLHGSSPGQSFLDKVAAPSQLHLLQHGMEAEDSGSLQDVRVQDPVLPFQLQYSNKAVAVVQMQIPGLVRLECPVLRSVKKCHQEEGLVHLKFALQVNTVAILHGGL
ncbi:unnamed protein product [Schistocephalus solidus]|uniref:ZU5 domain-containing protein n=1 Tax=Schistocephalus solidus TaxID=70667 RepID=A0A183SU63_SCHSO|nr:unnamed protein product [Schistocephalus solidus]